MTKREYLDYFMEKFGTDENVKAYVEHEKELLANKAKSNEQRKANKIAENKALEDKIFELLSSVDLATATEIGAEFKLTSQRVTPRLTAMVNDGRIVRIAEGKNIYFKTA